MISISKTHLLEGSDEAEAHDVNFSSPDNQPDKLRRLLKELQKENMALHASRFARTCAHSGA